MKIIANWFNYSMEGNPSGEVFVKPSLTVPGQVLSLQQLLDRLVRGENVTQFNATYSDDPDLPDVTALDEQERLMLSRQYGEFIEETKKQRNARLDRMHKEALARDAENERKSSPEPEASIM